MLFAQASMSSVPQSKPNKPTVRVLCGRCRKKLTDFDDYDGQALLSGDSQMMARVMTRMIVGGKITYAPRRQREEGSRYLCPKCGTDHLVRLDRLRRAYWRALRGRTERLNVIVLPRDL
jgi:predicted RNA-binding Zn-ribbon protein involved in translation (DUF1610 family)